MGKRIVIKTVFICLGIFLIINALLFSYVFRKYPLDFEEHINVVVAAVDIDEGAIIEKKHLKMREIEKSASHNLYTEDINQVIGKRAEVKILREDYLRTNILQEETEWYMDDDRIIILPVNMEERLANLILKGSYIDIRLKKEGSYSVETILEKVKVLDILDEAGIPLGSGAAVNSQKAYMKLVLNADERQQIYTATSQGKLIYELYCE